ncbi:hypothetical protein KR093_007256 [Drosophila rubida]|uniref:Guanylate cyclase n=1 Tax=Drosophila rubida TaxID=30044 RepID=A0AAD4PT34_9MUSC|nr:hypothetical protein KR093_007256 [Drosophila rubida]
MKLTICQIAKLFLLLTAFFFLNSHNVSSTLTTTTNSNSSNSTISTTSNSNSNSSNTNSNNNSNFKDSNNNSFTDPVALFVRQTTTQAGEVLKTTANATATATATATAAATHTFPAATKFSSNSILSKATTTTTSELQQQQPSRNAREFERQARQQQKPTAQQLQQQPQRQRQRRQQEQEQQRDASAAALAAQRVAVLIPSSLHTDMMQVQQGFQHFVDFFQVHLSNATVDFLHDVDLSGFIKLLELPKYTSVVKTLNAGINVDTDVDYNDDGNSDGAGAGAGGGVDPTKQPRQQQQQKQQQTQMKQLSADILSASAQQVKQRQQREQQQWQQHQKQQLELELETGQQQHSLTRSLGHCHQLAEQLAHDYNKSVVFWPCPHMKISSNFLPSFEAISLAVSSIASKLNWTQVDIYVGDDNWGLPLAIATNLHIPYRIEIGGRVRDLHEQDKPGRAIIITAPLNDDSTLRWLQSREWAKQQHTKVVLIDIVASSLNVEHRFYKYLAGNANANGNANGNGNGDGNSTGNGNGNPQRPVSGLVTSNLLVLTLLSDKHRHFLNAAGIGMTMVQNFRIAEMEEEVTTTATATPLLPQQNASLNKLRPFMNLFSLYDLLLSDIAPGHSTTTRTVPKYDFMVLDIVVDAALATYKWRPLLILEHGAAIDGAASYKTHAIQPGYDEWLLVSSVKMWHCGAICWTIAAICIGLLLIMVAASVAVGIAVRNYFLRKRLSKGPNKIVLSANDFVFPVDSRRVDEGIEAMLCCWLQQLQEFGGPEVDKPDLLKGSIGSLKNLGFVIPGAAAPGNNSGAIVAATAAAGTTTTTATVNGKSGSSATGSLARHNPAHLDMRARYNGDLVQLKEIHLNGSAELRSKAMDLLVMAHGLRHENINPLIGWLSDPNRTAMVFDYCSRGSLQDVLIMDEIKLDWSFRLSLLTDLVRGMRYLHASPLRVHGALTSRNCVVDARWVLKITDYGLNSFYEAQGISPGPRGAKELLWTAPELLRTMKTHQQQHHHHHQHGRIQMGTQPGDVYSFGIIMQEVVVRGEPYCMLSLSPDDIIAKIKKPPPLIRPSVSKGAAPPEAINIMRQCWAEQPDMRPDFNSVYERFKMLNHGRKVNFVDTMFQMLEKYSNNLEELIRERTDQLDIERKKTEQLLNRMLPSSVAEKLKMGLAVDPEEFSDVTIYFSDIVGFTTIAAHCSPVQVVDLLNDLYTIFDATINAYNVYKVETIGDAYMVVSGLPVKIPDHAEQIATMALDLLHQSGRFNVKHLPGVPLQLRIGLHTGPCCAGVVGLTMPRYCLFGDTVNTASRMESTGTSKVDLPLLTFMHIPFSGSSWRIHMSQETRDRLEARGGYSIEQRGLIEIKGKGMMNTFWLLGKKGFDKPLPTPPPIGLDESLIRNSIGLKAQANKSRTSTNPSSSQSSSLAGESVEVKVEITPPTNVDMGSSNLPNSYSLDSNSTNTISPNTTLCPEFPNKTPTSTSPQSRKLSELTPDSLLNPNTFNRLPNSTGGSSSRLYKKIEEMMDLSSPYNHYKCLSPSESNLTQFYDGKYLYGNNPAGHGHATGANGPGSGGCSVSGSTSKFDSKPGSSRLLRRQFSLDRDDQQSKVEQQHQHSLQASNYAALLHASKNSMLEIPMLHDTARSPKGTLSRVHKQNSSSIAQDLEKIEEIPLSPASSQHHSSLDSNLNRSPPSTLEAQSPPAMSASAAASQLSPPLLSAPTSPAPSRTLNGLHAHSLSSNSQSHSNNNNNSNSSSSSNATQETSPRPGPEITLNVEQLLSR